MTSNSDFVRVSPSLDLARLDNEVLELWERQDVFTQSVQGRPPEREYVFYDGPPFPTGSPHFGNLLAGVIKDVVPRYWTMRGYRVERRFGWDTHGLPIEMEAEKALGISGPRQIAEYGVARFNEACRQLVQANTENWERITRRIGRWVDFVNDYRTMDPEFMESVWWVFKELWDKGLVYKAFKVLPYSWGAATPLSNFEVNLGGYREVDDPSITVRLEVLEGKGAVAPGDGLLIWTTTPWTLPGNLAVAVGDDIDYVRVVDEGSPLWMAADRLTAYWKTPPEVTARIKGREMLGISYRPPFDYFLDKRAEGAFQVIISDSVTTEDGTGLVHMAPAYGEADFAALQQAGIRAFVDPVDASGKFTDQVPDVAEVNVKEADKVLVVLLKEAGILFRNERIRHSYPFCWRTDTPLMYKAIPTWFVAVEQIRERMAELNKTIHWVPGFVGSRRFGNWLEDARDWAVSRNRYWGSCVPVWECDGCDESVCIGSLDDLEHLSGVRPTDLHKHLIDPITWPCAQCGGTMRRVPEVLDGWFESGSMPYGQMHYPFENRERFEQTFPAQFIAEGLDQTRGWFYTLHVLATALFDSASFRNCVVNGLILAEDGRKMSKSLKNYPDPLEVLDLFGADALRAFLINSPVLRAEPVRFSGEGVREVVRSVLLPLWNAYSFFTTYAEADGITLADLSSAPPPGERAELDRWILSVLQSLTDEVNQQMEGYYLYNVIPPTLGFIDQLTNWYVRRSRRRFWRTRGEDDADKLSAFATLYEVLVAFSQVLAPVLPFITERLYQDLVVRVRPNQPASVHLCDFPIADAELIDRGLEKAMEAVRRVVGLGHNLRKQHQLRVRQPLRAVTVVTHDPLVSAAIESHRDLVADELNVKEVAVQASSEGLADLSAKADFRILGPRLGGRTKEVATAIAALTHQEIEQLLAGETLSLVSEPITLADVVIDRTPIEGVLVASDGDLAVALDAMLDAGLVAEGLAREIVSRVQQMRRGAGLEVTERISLRWATESSAINEAFDQHGDYIAREVLAEQLSKTEEQGELIELDGHSLTLQIARAP
jgi:isoleucyl-tRNA synthetase